MEVHPPLESQIDTVENGDWKRPRGVPGPPEKTLQNRAGGFECIDGPEIEPSTLECGQPTKEAG